MEIRSSSPPIPTEFPVSPDLLISCSSPELEQLAKSNGFNRQQNKCHSRRIVVKVRQTFGEIAHVFEVDMLHDWGINAYKTFA